MMEQNCSSVVNRDVKERKADVETLVHAKRRHDWFG